MTRPNSPAAKRRSRSRKSPSIKHVDFPQLEDVTLTVGDGKPSAAVDLLRIERAVREIMIAIGEDPDREGLRKTPNRIARAYTELTAGLRSDRCFRNQLLAI